MRSARRSAASPGDGWALALLLAGGLLSVPSSALPAGRWPPPVTFTARQDHRNMMEQLGIERLRPGTSGNENAPNHANYDEALANPYPNIPDPLRLDDGQPVTSARMWWRERRPQLVAAFEQDVYGRIPADVPKVTWRVAARGRGLLGGYPIVYRRLMIESAHNNITPDKQDAWLQRSEQVLAMLVRGGKFVPNESLTRPHTRGE